VFTYFDGYARHADSPLLVTGFLLYYSTPHAPTAQVIMYNATQAARDRMPEVFEVRLERGPGYVCNSSDKLVVYY
jgi:hypothetical protein